MIKTTLTTLLSALFLAISASAAPFAYDSFTAVSDPTPPGAGEYDDDLTLTGQTAPTVSVADVYQHGWTGDWLSGTGTGGILGSGGLSYPAVASTGGAVGATNARVGRLLGTAYDTTSSGTVYLSFMMQATTTTDYAAFELHNGGFTDSFDRRFQIGIGENGSSDYAVRLFNNNDDGFYGSLGPVNTDVNFIVVKLTFGAGNNEDAVDVWFNPTGAELDAESAAGPPDYTKSGFNLNFDRTSLANFGSGAVWDELRIGNTWGDVVPTTPQDGVMIDFETYSLSDVVGQSENGRPWATQFGDTSNFDVVGYDGGQTLSVQSTGTSSGSNWIPQNDSERLFTFDNSSSVVTFSFDVARPLDGGQTSTVSLNLVDLNAANEVMAFDFWGMGDGLAVYSNSNASGSAGNLLKSAGISMPTGSTGYFNVSATIDFATNEVTSLLYGGVEQLTGSITLGAIADTTSTLGVYFVAPNDNGNAIYFDNITIAPPGGGTAEIPILDIAISGNDAQVSFAAEDGVTYQLEKRSSLTSGDWSEVVGASVTNTGGGAEILTDTGTLPGNPDGFYRVVVTL